MNKQQIPGVGVYVTTDTSKEGTVETSPENQLHVAIGESFAVLTANTPSIVYLMERPIELLNDYAKRGSSRRLKRSEVHASLMMFRLSRTQLNVTRLDAVALNVLASSTGCIVRKCQLLQLFPPTLDTGHWACSPTVALRLLRSEPAQGSSVEFDYLTTRICRWLSDKVLTDASPRAGRTAISAEYIVASACSMLRL